MTQAVPPYRRSKTMGADQTAIEELRSEIEVAPHDPYLRCNLACSLASAGQMDAALRELAVATQVTSSQIAAGCVAAAVRDVADSFAQTWALPTMGVHLVDAG
ncbi:MAG: hypothetical protein AB8G26_18100 [Ilumatobacter sp.]